MPSKLNKILWTVDFTPPNPPELKGYALMIRKLYEQLARAFNAMVDVVNACECSGSGAVTSVFGRTGAVVAVTNDYTQSQIAAGAIANGSTATTQALGDNTTKIATDAFVANAIAAIPGTPSYSIASVAVPATVNLTTEGTIDWQFWGNSQTSPDLLVYSGMSSTLGAVKANGGRQIQMRVACSIAINSVTQTGLPVCSFSAGDASYQGTSGSFTPGSSALNFIAGAVNIGYSISVPCDSFQRVLRLYTDNGNYIVNAIFTDGSLSPSTFVDTGSKNKITITYKGKKDGQRLILFMGNSGITTNNMRLYLATLGLV